MMLSDAGLARICARPVFPSRSAPLQELGRQRHNVELRGFLISHAVFLLGHWLAYLQIVVMSISEVMYLLNLEY
jgi:hypothetical protein